MIKQLALRALAVFVASGLGTIGAGSLFGVEAATAVGIAGTLAVATVLEKLARAYYSDGTLTQAEIEDAFKDAEKGKRK